MPAKNILFIMCDRLRFDYLGCTGHPTIRTPNIDRLAARGVTFANAHCQSPVCGPSRASVHTGRYVSSHGSTTLFMPLKVGEMNIGDHLNPLGMRHKCRCASLGIPNATTGRDRPCHANLQAGGVDGAETQTGGGA